MVMFMLAALPLLFTSCGEYGYVYETWEIVDDADHGGGNNINNYVDMANTLRGHWSGRIEVSLKDNYGNITRRTYDTEFEFDQTNSNSTNGRGIEIDYDGDVKVYQSKFSWYIDTNTEEIVINYDDDDHRLMRVFEYHLDDSSFRGKMDRSDGMEQDVFQLSRYTYSKTNRIFEKEAE